METTEWTISEDTSEDTPSIINLSTKYGEENEDGFQIVNKKSRKRCLRGKEVNANKRKEKN